MGVPISGRFTRFDATVDIDAASPERSSASLRVDVGSMTTGNDEADAIATGAEWLDEAHAPTAVFRATSIRLRSPGRYEARGALTMRNKTRDMVIGFEVVEQPNGRTIISSRFDIARSEFGVGGGVWNQGGVVAEIIPVAVRLVLAPAARAGH